MIEFVPSLMATYTWINYQASSIPAEKNLFYFSLFLFYYLEHLIRIFIFYFLIYLFFFFFFRYRGD